MKHKFFLVSGIVILLLGLSVSVYAEVVLLDNFDGVSLDTSVWSEVPEGAKGLEQRLSDDSLVVEDISNPSVINETAGGEWALVTLFSQNFDPPLSDFTIKFQFSWSSDDPDTGGQSVQAMQGIYIQGYDVDATQIARVGYFDPWINYPGGKAGKIRGGDEINAGQHRLELSGSATVNLSRTGEEVVVSWDGEQLMTGINAKPLQSIGILFYYYPYTGTSGPSYFGTETVDLVQVAESIDDITTSSTSSTSSVTTTCPPDKPTECEDGTCCGYLDECCGDGTCCDFGKDCCGGVCCDSEEEICCGNFCCNEDTEVCCYNVCCPICIVYQIYGRNSDEAKLLRKFRDEVLSTSLIGNEIIDLYYLWSPPIVKMMEEDKVFREELKEAIDGILPMLREEVE